MGQLTGVRVNTFPRSNPPLSSDTNKNFEPKIIVFFNPSSESGSITYKGVAFKWSNIRITENGKLDHTFKSSDNRERVFLSFSELDIEPFSPDVTICKYKIIITMHKVLHGNITELKFRKIVQWTDMKRDTPHVVMRWCDLSRLVWCFVSSPITLWPNSVSGNQFQPVVEEAVLTLLPFATLCVAQRPRGRSPWQQLQHVLVAYVTLRGNCNWIK